MISKPFQHACAALASVLEEVSDPDVAPVLDRLERAYGIERAGVLLSRARAEYARRTGGSLS